MTVWPSDTEVEFNEKRAYLLAIASRLAFTSDDVDAIRRYIDAILATKNDEYIISMWHSLVGYRMSTGIGPSGRNFFDALLKALPADHVSR